MTELLRKSLGKKSTAMYAFIVLVVLGLVVALPVPTKALQTTGPLDKSTRTLARASASAARQDAQLTNVITRANTMITDRIDSLQKLLTRISSDPRLSDADKASLTNEINTTITNLNTLKTKIDADTDLATARADTKSIVTAYRIYVIFEPKIRLLITISNLQTESGKVSSLSAKVATLLTTLASQGKNVTSAQKALSDLQTQLTTINTTLATDKTLIENVTVNTTSPQSVFVQVRKDLAGVRNNFAQIRHDFAQIRSVIHNLFPHPTNASESAK